MGKKVRDLWLGISLKKKINSYAVLVILVMGLSAVFSIQVVNFALDNFNVILYDNSRCHDFMEAMDLEVRAFETYAKDRSEEYREEYVLACVRTERCIRALPYDYDQIGNERYAVTWSIKNSYENYQKARNSFLEMDQEEEGYIPELYRIYDMQSYIQDYAMRLVQVTLSSGNASYQEKVSALYKMPYLIVAFSVFLMVVVIAFTGVMANTLVQPLVKLAQSSRKIAKNDFSEQDMTVENRDEMGELVKAFNKMKHSTEGYINTLKKNHEMAELLHKEERDRFEMEKQLDAARLEFLKSQVNPHFLFNTLNMIACTAKLEKASATEKMIASLSNLFRYNLKTSEQTVLLEQELKVADDYIYIQKMRFGSRIRYDKSVEVDSRAVQIPALILQPLVENAVIHGLSKKEQGGRIHLRIWRRENTVVISVADTGSGMPESRMTEILEAVKSRQSRTSKVGIGLGNICKRVNTMYGEGSVRIYSKEGRGTVIQMVIPQTQQI